MTVMPTTKKTTQPTARVRKSSSKAPKSRRTSPQDVTVETETMSMSRPSMPVMNMNLDPEKKKKLMMVAVLGIILAVLYYAKGLFVVAFVNGQPITRYEVIKDLEKQAGKGSVDALVSKRLVRMDAEKKGITVPQSDIDARIKQIEDDLKSSGQKLDDLLKAQGVTRAEVEEQTELQLMLKKILKDKVKVSDAEVDAAYEQQKEAKPEGMTDEAFKKQMRSSLEEQKFSFEAQTYIQGLQSKAKVTYWHEY